MIFLNLCFSVEIAIERITKIVSSKNEGKWQIFMERFDRKKGDEEFVKEVGTEVNYLYPGHLNTSLLHHVIRNWQYVTLIEDLIRLGAKPLAAESNGETPLHVAVHVSASNEVITALLRTKHEYNKVCEEDCNCGLLALKVSNLKQQCPKDIKPITQEALKLLKSQGEFIHVYFSIN